MREPEIVGDGPDPEVLGQGDERAPRRLGTFVAGAAALALLAVGVAGALRSPEGEPDARPTPTPSRVTGTAGWTEYPTEDPFETYVGAVRPKQGSPTPLLLAGGIPILLTDQGGDVVAYELLGGPSYAPVLLGLCPADGSLVSPGGEYVYLDGLPSGVDLAPLRRYPVRDSTEPDHVEIALDPQPQPPPLATVALPPACEADDLVYPALPEPVDRLSAAGSAFVLMEGRYVVTTETRAFCPIGADCRAAGWEAYGPHPVLPPWDRAGSYEWQGTFLVHADPRDGSLTVARTRESSLVRRERVGVSVRVGWVESSYERGGVVHLRFNAVRAVDGTAADDSPGGDPRIAPAWVEEYVDERGGLRDYALAPGAEVHLAGGVTGIGRPRGTPAVLREHLKDVAPYDDPPLWLVLDAKGRVIRVVEEARDGVR